MTATRPSEKSIDVDQPRVGMLATVRNRRALIASAEPFDTPEGRLHLVSLKYTEPDGVLEDFLIWEREVNRSLVEPTALAQIATEPSMLLSSKFDVLTTGDPLDSPFPVFAARSPTYGFGRDRFALFWSRSG
jgi:hypothetical protein